VSAVFALSVVAPCYNEEAGLAAFVARMTADQPRIVGVRLSRNHGHQLAVTAGLGLVRGRRVMVIDADLQDPPELAGPMIARLDEGYDVVFGRRRQRAGESAFKRTTASLFYRTLAALTETEIPLDTGDFRLMSRRIVDRLNAMPERDRFIRGMVAWLGGRQTEFLYDRDPRMAGQTHYTLRRMVRLAIDGLTGFSTAPLRLAMILAGFGMVVAAGLLVYVLWGFLTHSATRGWTSLALIVVFFSTAQLACLAIFGEYLGRTYMQSKGRPLYMIDEILAGDAAEARD